MILGVDLAGGETPVYDEYPAYRVECEDDGESWFMTLLGVPDDLDSILAKYPYQFDIEDRNYSLTICAHKGLPVSPETGLDLPWNTDSELAQGLMGRLRAAGFEFYEGKLPYTRSEELGLVEYPVK
ncbi:hypothetical protein [Variovorax boronicumulans]|uniref:hypothetical protein n=1 Tax=Variovorax boronicumulans TaxID=436515 RepID=UPI0033927F6F